MDNTQKKPRLVFFQVKYDQTLPAFLLMHKREHVTCLSEWFDVIVISDDCDYQQICDTYLPDITLFESGVNHETCRRLRIQNVRAYSKVPKLGLHHADAFCNARAGFLSDMDQWGIETFFAISTTAAEHTPEIANRLFVWPVFVDAAIYRDYGGWKSIPVLVTGNRNSLYPWRQQIVRRLSEIYPTLLCPHPGYEARASTSRVLMGEEYARTINASWFVPACGTVAKEAVRKHFEIPASRACLVAERSSALDAAGFIDMKNCVFADDRDVLEKLDYLFRTPDVLDAIITSGYQMVHSRHTLTHRNQIYQWFTLYRDLKPNQHIIQKGPFKPLTVVDNSRGKETYHIVSNGLHLQLLRQGDEKLRAGKHKEAEGLYIRCTHYMPWMPEPKLRLALCNLYGGNAKGALSWLDESLQFTLCVYKAIDPDPVEWAYYIVSWLCLGKVEAAAKHAREFEWLHHSELDRARWATILLDAAGVAAPLTREDIAKRRLSIHRLPDRSFKEWVEQLCIMLTACGQSRFAQTIRSCGAEGTAESLNRWGDRDFAREIEAGDVADRQQKAQTKETAGRGRGEAYRASDRSRYFSTMIRKLARPFKEAVHRIEARHGYFMPYRLSNSRKDECFQAIEELAGDEDVKFVLVIGAALGHYSTEAVLTGILKNKAKPVVFCVGDSGQRFTFLCGTVPSSPSVKWCPLSGASPVNLSHKLEEIIEKIKEATRISSFDVVLVTGSEFGGQVTVSDLLSEELANARLVVLDDINSPRCCRNFDRLLRNPQFVLIDSNPGLRNGYAIFKMHGRRPERAPGLMEPRESDGAHRDRISR